MGVKDNTKQPSSIGTEKHSAPEVATQPSGCVRSMKACPCSVSAQWKSRVPLLLTPHYPTQYSNPARQLNWVVPHVRASIHQKSSLARFFPLCIYYVFIESEFSLTFGLTAEATPWADNKQIITSSVSVQNLYRVNMCCFWADKMLLWSVFHWSSTEFASVNVPIISLHYSKWGCGCCSQNKNPSIKNFTQDNQPFCDGNWLQIEQNHQLKCTVSMVAIVTQHGHLF